MAELDDVASSIGTLSPNDRKLLSKRLASSLTREHLSDFVSSISGALPERDQKDLALKAVADLPASTQTDVVTEAANNLPPKEREDLATHLAAPSGGTRDRLWLIVISAFSFVLIASFVTLAIAVFHSKPQTPIASGELILTMFTSAVGFLAGLFVPSPAGKQS